MLPTHPSQGNTAWYSYGQSLHDVVNNLPNVFSAVVWQEGGNVKAADQYGVNLYDDTITSAHNAAAIQAAIDDVAGTQDIPGSGSETGYGGGGCVIICSGLYEVSTTITLKYGVSIWCPPCGLDRDGIAIYAISAHGTTLAAVSGFAGPVLAMGVTASGSRSTTNPHGVTVENLNIAGYAATSNLIGIRMRDTQHCRIVKCAIYGFVGTNAIGISVESSLAPDDGGLSNHFIECRFEVNTKSLVASGTGSTDGRVVGGIFVGHTVCAIELGSSGGGGGWQILGGIHFSTGSNAFHVNVAGSPCMISGGHYFDTTGTGTSSDNYHITISSGVLHVIGCHFKCSGSGGPRAPIRFENSSAQKCSVIGNTLESGSGTRGLVETANSGQFIVMGNTLDNDSGAWVAPVVTTANAAIANNEASGRHIVHNIEVAAF